MNIPDAIIEELVSTLASQKRGTTMKTITVGSRVRYKASFLRSICCYGGDMAHGKGTVTLLEGTKDFMIASIEWENCKNPPRVNTHNLEITK